MSILTNILRDGGAGYNAYTTDITYPGESFASLSSSARAIILLGNTDFDFQGFVNPFDLVPNNWDETQRKIFDEMSSQEQVDVCAFVTSIVHELLHHLDFLQTPFGASFHEKLCREFLAFEHWVPTLLECSIEFFNQPLVDWVQSAPAGLDATRMLQEGSPLDQALVELRGPIAFDEVRRGTMPRHVKQGWGSNTNALTTLTGGRKYEKVTINQVWASIRLENGSRYLSPNEVIEGRTFAMSLIYLFHLLGENVSTIDVVRSYIDHFYKGQSTYLSLLEIHSGTDIYTLLDGKNFKMIKRRLWETVVNGWYSLHSPIAIKPEDILQSMTARCIQIARVMRDTDLSTFSTYSAFLSTVDDYYAKDASARPIRETLKISAERLSLSIAMCKDCIDTEMRSWYDEILQVIRENLLERIPSGYELGTGLPPDGNPMNWVDDCAIRCCELSKAPQRIIDWYELRQLLLTKRDHAEEKLERLRDFFSYI
jgi:hypothetical protein